MAAAGRRRSEYRGRFRREAARMSRADFPEDIRGLIEDLEREGFKLVAESDHPWPGGPRLRLARRQMRGVSQVSLNVDHGMWEVMVKVGWHWYEPFWALRVVNGDSDERHALNHAELRKYTLQAVGGIRGTRADKRELRRRQRARNRALTRWAEGKGPHP